MSKSDAVHPNDFRAALLEVVSDALAHSGVAHGEDKAFCQRLLERALPVIPGAQAGSIILAEPSGYYRVYAAVGYDTQLREVAFTFDEIAPTIDVRTYAPRLTCNYTAFSPVRRSTRQRQHEVGGVGSGAGTLAPTQSVALSVPITVNGKLRAVLYFDTSSGPDAFSQATLETAQIFGAQLGIVLPRFSAQAPRQQGQMNALVAANEALRSAATFAEVYDASAALMAARTAAQVSCVLRFDADRDVLTVVAARSGEGEHLVGQEVARGQGASWRILTANARLTLTDVHAADELGVHLGEAGATLQHYLGSPLHDPNGETVGVLCAWGAAPFSPDEAAFNEAVAQSATSALVRLGLVGKAKREARAYRALATFGETIEEINDAGELMELGLTRLLEQLGLDAAVHYDVQDGLCYPAGIYGAYPEQLELIHAPVALGDGMVGRVARTGEVASLSDYSRWPHALPAYLELGLRTLLAIPVKRQGVVVKVAALICFYRRVRLSDEQLVIARNFVKRLENALERADNLREVEATREATLRALGLVLEQRDFETKGHTDRVVGASLRFGKRLGLGKRTLQALRWGAYLHDIGKVAVPDAILLKPGKLEPHEFEVIKTHTLSGDTTCRDIPFLPLETCQVVRHHHERWDGRGYPDGRAGDAIPLLARIFSLVDVFDALTSVRPYKAAWSTEQAAAEIVRCAGTQFDPSLVSVFAALCNEGVLG